MGGVSGWRPRVAAPVRPHGEPALPVKLIRSERARKLKELPSTGGTGWGPSDQEGASHRFQHQAMCSVIYKGHPAAQAMLLEDSPRRSLWTCTKCENSDASALRESA
jgi:hypothetical protein